MKTMRQVSGVRCRGISQVGQSAERNAQGPERGRRTCGGAAGRKMERVHRRHAHMRASTTRGSRRTGALGNKLQKWSVKIVAHSHTFTLLKWAALAFRRGKTAAAGAACRGSAQGTALQAGQGWGRPCSHWGQLSEGWRAEEARCSFAPPRWGRLARRVIRSWAGPLRPASIGCVDWRPGPALGWGPAAAAAGCCPLPA